MNGEEVTTAEMHFARRVAAATEGYLRQALTDTDLQHASPEYRRGFAHGLREASAMFTELMMRECRRCPR